MDKVDTNKNRSFMKRPLFIAVILCAAVIGIFLVRALIDAPYVAYERSLASLKNEIEHIDYNKYVEQNDWLYSIAVTNVKYDSETFKYRSGKEVTQENSVYYDGVCTGGFEKKSSETQALLMCSAWGEIVREAEDIYHNSDYYEKFGKDLEAGKTINFRNDVKIIGIDKRYTFQVGTTDGDYFLTLDSNGDGTFISKTYANDQEYYYRYNLKYIDGELAAFNLDYYSIPDGQEYYEDNNSNFNSSNGNQDLYDSGRYRDADSFAEDYYEEFYDYDDYEDDDDAYDEAVDYWNEWND